MDNFLVEAKFKRPTLENFVMWISLQTALKVMTNASIHNTAPKEAQT